MPRPKKILIKDVDEFNKIAARFAQFEGPLYDRQYKIISETCGKQETARLRCPYIKQSGIYARIAAGSGLTYLFDLTGDVEDANFAMPTESIILSAAHALSKIDYDDISKDVERRERYGFKTVKIDPTQTKVSWSIRPALAYTWVAEDLTEQELTCWGYDINSSFPYALTLPMPDTRNPQLNARIGRNQIGFDDCGAVSTDPGVRMQYVFDLMPSPFIEYVTENYALKRSSTSERQRHYYKGRLNFFNGLLARHNIFLYNTVLYYAAKRIKSFIDQDTVYVNVDSIVSLTKRPDLKISDSLGDFKLEHEGQFKYKAPGIYQWQNSTDQKEIHYKGVNKNLVSDISDTQYQKNKSMLKYIIKNNQIELNRRVICQENENQ